MAVAANGNEALARFPAARPQVVVLDLQIPGPNGVAVTAEVVRQDPSARVLILSASGEQADVLEAVKAGATGYLVKSASRERADRGGTPRGRGRHGLHPRARRTGAGRVPPDARRVDRGRRRSRRAAGLTDRETEVLKMVAKGMSYKQIAERLVISHRTVQNHVQNTLRKLQMHNRVELTRYAIEQGLDDDADDLTLLGVADELYGLALPEFTPTRDARAKELKAADAQLAPRVKALRKPSMAAWVVNLLVRQRVRPGRRRCSRSGPRCGRRRRASPARSCGR